MPVNVHSSNGGCFGPAEMGGRKIPSSVLQVTYVNKRKVKFNSKTRSFQENSLNAINFPDKPACPIPN